MVQAGDNDGGDDYDGGGDDADDVGGDACDDEHDDTDDGDGEDDDNDDGDELCSCCRSGRQVGNSRPPLPSRIAHGCIAVGGTGFWTTQSLISIICPCECACLTWLCWIVWKKFLWVIVLLKITSTSKMMKDPMNDESCTVMTEES